MITYEDRAMAEVLDPLDTEVIDIALTAREVYLVLNALYFDTTNAPTEVLDVVKYIENRLLDTDLPLTQEEFSSEYLNDHSDNEQYKRIIFATSEAP